MTVFVLLGETDCEGSTLLGVYTSIAAAESAYATYLEDHSRFDSYCIEEVGVGAPAEVRW